MLSNCKDCQFNSGSNQVAACAVNPKYWEMFKLLTDGNSFETLSQYEAILSCPDFQTSEELQEKTIELTLTLREWKKVIDAASRSDLSKKIVSQIREALDIPEPEGFGNVDIPF